MPIWSSEPLRVLTFLHSFDPGGVERVALRLNRAWAAAGHDVHVVMGRADGVLAPDAAELPLTILSSGRIPTARWETLWMILTLPSVVRRLRPDVLFCSGNTYTVVAVALRLILGRACPQIVAKVSNDFDRGDLHPIARWFYHRWLRVQARFVATFVGIAEPMREQIERQTGIEPARVDVINDPAMSMADIDAFEAPRVAHDGGRRFIAVGRLVAQKNFARAVVAFAQIARTGDTLTIYGDGPEHAQLERAARKLGVEAAVRLPGFVHDLPARFAEADVFVLSSDYEGVPAVIVDALAAGITIVATDCCVSMPDLLGGGRFGTLVPRDTGALAAAMDGALDAASDRAAMRAHAQHFTIEAAAPRWWALFATVAAAPLVPVALPGSPFPRAVNPATEAVLGSAAARGTD